MAGLGLTCFLVASVCKCKLKVKDNITRIKPESTNMLQHIGCVNITKQKWLGMALYPHVDLFTMQSSYLNFHYMVMVCMFAFMCSNIIVGDMFGPRQFKKWFSPAREALALLVIGLLLLQFMKRCVAASPTMLLWFCHVGVHLSISLIVIPSLVVFT